MSRFRDAYLDELAEHRAEQKAEREPSPMEWFDWFVTTEEYKELIKEISKNPTTQISPNSSGESGSA